MDYIGILNTLQSITTSLYICKLKKRFFHISAFNMEAKQFTEPIFF